MSLGVKQDGVTLVAMVQKKYLTMLENIHPTITCLHPVLFKPFWYQEML